MELLGQKLIIAATSYRPLEVEAAIALGKFHRIEYLELARFQDSPYLDYSDLPQNRWRQMEEWLKLDFQLANRVAQAARRAQARIILCCSERVGIPLALLRPQARIVVIAHNPFSEKKHSLITRLANRWDGIILFSQVEANEFVRRIPGAAQRVHVVPPSIDTDFYQPAKTSTVIDNYVFSIGLIHRDYQVLVDAFTRLPEALQCRISASSLWDKDHINWGRKKLPSNVRQDIRIDPLDVRAAAGNSLFLVVPIRPANNGWNDGCTSVLLAGAMGKAIVATATPGLSEFVLPGKTGLLVPPKDPQALANAIEDLWLHPEVANEMGRQARIHAETFFSYPSWLSEMNKILGTI